MRDHRAAPDPADPALAALALLCAGGELEGPEAEAFERRLSDDHAAREALAQAVLLTQAVAGRPAPLPDPAYRDRVRRRLRAGRGFGRHPAVWAGLGAVAAVLAMLALPRTSPDAQPVLPPSAARPAAVGEAAPAPAPEKGAGPSLDEAEAWSRLSSSGHLEQAVEDLRRRKEDRGRGWPPNDPRSGRLIGQRPVEH
jgi:hypothetical protein